jgi:hypothetical protein
MRSVLWLTALLVGCQSSSQVDTRRDSPGSSITDQSSSEVPPRGVEAMNTTGNVPPADGGFYLPGSRAQEVARNEEAERAALRGNPLAQSGERSDAGLEVTAAADEAGPCTAAADCTTTRVPTGGCCATLCDARPITTVRAAELAPHYASCRNCPVPLCRPSRYVRVPACVEGRCKMVPINTD